MKGIINWLFGRRTEIFDQRLGTFTSRVRSNDPVKSYTWEAEHQIPKQQHTTLILIDGTFKGPTVEYRGAVHRILREMNEIKDSIDRQIRKKPGYVADWKNSFELRSILGMDEELLEFELNFSKEEEDDHTEISVYWVNGDLEDAEVY